VILGALCGYCNCSDPAVFAGYERRRQEFFSDRVIALGHLPSPVADGTADKEQRVAAGITSASFEKVERQRISVESGDEMSEEGSSRAVEYAADEFPAGAPAPLDSATDFDSNAALMVPSITREFLKLKHYRINARRVSFEGVLLSLANEAA
jgi:hypothetical protein